MRIIHTGDLHLDIIPGYSRSTVSSDSSQSSIRRWHTFQRLITYANDCSADLLLICGDLFHRPPSLSQLKEVDSLFASLIHTQVVIIAGNHDYLSTGLPMADYHWCDQVTLLPEFPGGEVYFSELNTVIHGFSYSSYRLKQSFIPDAPNHRDGRYHILMLHGGDTEHFPIDFSILETTDFDYIALGHIHKPKIFPGRRMAYCGSPEPLDHTESGNHGFVQVDMLSDTVDLSFIPFSDQRYLPLTLQVTPEDTLFTLRKVLSSRIEQSHSGDVFLPDFIGFRSPEISISMDTFSDLEQLHSISDHTQPWYDFDHLLRVHGSDLIGLYIRSFLSPGSSPNDLDETQRQALYLGLQALFETADG